MSIIDNRQEFRPASGEAPFELEEVFFSRTDKRGVIEASNYVFRRVSNFEWSELLGAPHKLIRHPDMPRAVFWLLWQTIQTGKPIGAYVKNQAKDGLYYWVFAVVVPTKDGYLSARIKPTSRMLGVIEKEYANLRQRELDEGLSPETSANLLLKRLEAHGYSTYAEFSTCALAEELSARDAGLNQGLHHQMEGLRDTVNHAERLKAETRGLIDDFNAMRTVPHNLQVIASRMEPTGGPVSTLSKNYAVMSRDMFEWFEKHVLGEDSNFSTIKSSVTNTLFVLGMSRVLTTCDKQLTFERRKLADVNIEDERAILRELVTNYSNESALANVEIAEEAQRILDACDIMERHLLGLSTTRVMCKIEGARMTKSGESLKDIIGQLMVFQNKISGRLDQIRRLGHEIRDRLAS